MREIRPETVLVPHQQEMARPGNTREQIPESKYLRANSVVDRRLRRCITRYGAYVSSGKLDTVGSMHPEQQGGEP